MPGREAQVPASPEPGLEQKVVEMTWEGRPNHAVELSRLEHGQQWTFTKLEGNSAGTSRQFLSLSTLCSEHEAPAS